MRLIIYCAVFFIKILNVYGQYNSPCPGIFSYQNDGARVYGLIHLEPIGQAVSTLEVRLNYTVAAYVTGNLGEIKPADNVPPGLLIKNYNRGIPINLRVHFPISYPLPSVTAIVVNGRAVCLGPGDAPAPNKYISTVALEAKLYMEEAPGRPNSGQNYYDNYEPVGHNDPFDYIVGSVGDNTLTTINLDNKGTWNLYPGNGGQMVTVYEPQPNRPSRPNRPKPRPEIYYPAPTTEANRPQNIPPRPQRPQIYYPPTEKTTLPPAPPPVTQPPQNFPSRKPEFSTQIECGVIAGGNERIPLIYQGVSYPRGDLPWLVAVYKRQEGSLTFICAGTLVSDRHVVTAAHCMHQKSKLSTIKDMVVKVGVYNLEDWGDDISVTRTLQAAAIHQSYNATTLENDILVLTMERTVEFNTYIRPACLWNGNTDLTRVVGATGVVAGWGANEVGPIGQGEPRMVRIPIVSTAQCRASKPEFHKLTSERTLCAGDRKGSGPCLGDSGGGLYILDNGRWRLRGVVSLSLRPQNGVNSCNLDDYVVFTDTAQYLSWIRKILNQNYFDT